MPLLLKHLEELSKNLDAHDQMRTTTFLIIIISSLLATHQWPPPSPGVALNGPEVTCRPLGLSAFLRLSAVIFFYRTVSRYQFTFLCDCYADAERSSLVINRLVDRVTVTHSLFTRAFIATRSFYESFAVRSFAPLSLSFLSRAPLRFTLSRNPSSTYRFTFRCTFSRRRLLVAYLFAR